MVSQKVTVLNKLGIHARPATKLVRLASKGNSKVFITKNGQRINAQSILGVMLLQAEHGSTILIEVDGADEEIMLQKLVNLISSGFEEE
ncbi:HPr family phosphocarrier protein [bacterium]|nr:HPr family phosphocarrier protein [bacterium]